MDLNAYTVEALAHGHLVELRRTAARLALVRAGRRPRRGVRVVLGEVLIRLGTRALGREQPVLVSRA
jgi:hypothetical protein